MGPPPYVAAPVTPTAFQSGQPSPGFAPTSRRAISGGGPESNSLGLVGGSHGTAPDGAANPSCGPGASVGKPVRGGSGLRGSRMMLRPEFLRTEPVPPVPSRHVAPNDRSRRGTGVAS